MKASPKRSVLIAECEPLARRGIAAMIEERPGLHVCAQAASTAEARALCERHRPAVLVIDPAQDDGFALIRDLSRWNSATTVVAYTALEDAGTMQRALQAGALGYVSRRDSSDALLHAILAALDGERFVGPRVQSLLFGEIARGTIGRRDAPLAALSDRERDVFRLLGANRTTRQIAEELHMSVKTVETHRGRIRKKLGLTTNAELQHTAWLHARETGPSSFGEPEVSGRMLLEC